MDAQARRARQSGTASSIERRTFFIFCSKSVNVMCRRGVRIDPARYPELNTNNFGFLFLLFVYDAQARRARGDMLVALKEVPLADVGVFGATDAERK